MNYCQFRNQTIKRMANAGGGILPAEYQQVEYLRADGNQYIETGISSATPISRYYCKFFINVIQSDNYIFGCWGQNGRFFIYFNNSVTELGYARRYVDGSPFATNTVCEIEGELQPGSQSMYVNGTLSISMAEANTPTPAIQIPLFANRSGGSVYPCKISIYRFTLESNGSKILDYIPCYRKSDNKPGMYDLVTNTFFTNAGTGEFTVGNNV